MSQMMQFYVIVRIILNECFRAHFRGLCLLQTGPGHVTDLTVGVNGSAARKMTALARDRGQEEEGLEKGP